MDAESKLMASVHTTFDSMASPGEANEPVEALVDRRVSMPARRSKKFDLKAFLIGYVTSYIPPPVFWYANLLK